MVQPSPAPPAVAPRVRPPPQGGPRDDVLRAQQAVRCRSRAAHRRGRRRGRAGRPALARRAGVRSGRSVRPAPDPGRHHRGGLGPRVDHGLHRRRPVADPGPADRARHPHGGLRPRAGARAGLLRGPQLGRADVDPQRRREPARAVPRLRGQRDDPHGGQRALRRHHLRGHLPDPHRAGVPPDPGDHPRVAALPADASRSATTPCGRRPATSPIRSPTTSAASPRSRRSAPRGARSTGWPRPARPTAMPTARPSATPAPSCRSSAWRSWRGSP